MRIFISLSAIRLSDYKKWGGYKHFDKTLYKEIFERYSKKKNAYRIYLPIVGQGKYEPISTPKELENFIISQGYKLEDYAKGIVSKDNGKRLLKIGKILKNNPELLDLYQKHKAKLGPKNTSDLLVVISRHPYDIAGMSTDRSWKSCTRLGYRKKAFKGIHYKENDEEYDDSEPGENAKYVLHDVKEGHLIAYLINSNDLNIQRPIARMRILRYVTKDKKHWILKSHPIVYGSDTQVFRKTVDAWLKEINIEKADDYYIYDRIDNADQRITIRDDASIKNDIKNYNYRVFQEPSFNETYHKLCMEMLEKISPQRSHIDFFIEMLEFDSYLTSIEYKYTLDIIIKLLLKMPGIPFKARDFFRNSNIFNHYPDIFNKIRNKGLQNVLLTNPYMPVDIWKKLFLEKSENTQINILKACSDKKWKSICDWLIYEYGNKKVIGESILSGNFSIDERHLTYLFKEFKDEPKYILEVLKEYPAEDSKEYDSIINDLIYNTNDIKVYKFLLENLRVPEKGLLKMLDHPSPFMKNVIYNPGITRNVVNKQIMHPNHLFRLEVLKNLTDIMYYTKSTLDDTYYKQIIETLKEDENDSVRKAAQRVYRIHNN